MGLALWPLLGICALQEAKCLPVGSQDTAQSPSTTLHCSSLDLVLMSQFAQRHRVNLNAPCLFQEAASQGWEGTPGGRARPGCPSSSVAPELPASSPKLTAHFAGPQGAVWLCPEDNWAQFPPWHFRGPATTVWGKIGLRKKVLFLENHNHSSPWAARPAPRPSSHVKFFGVRSAQSVAGGHSPTEGWAWMQTRPSEKLQGRNQGPQVNGLHPPDCVAVAVWLGFPVSCVSCNSPACKVRPARVLGAEAAQAGL